MSAHYQVAVSGVIPALLVMWLVDRLDAKRPEPVRTRRLIVLFGMLSVVPALVLEIALSSFIGENLEPQLTYQGSSHPAGSAASGAAGSRAHHEDRGDRPGDHPEDE
jgi:hypothetical protein